MVFLGFVPQINVRFCGSSAARMKSSLKVKSPDFVIGGTAHVPGSFLFIWPLFEAILNAKRPFFLVHLIVCIPWSGFRISSIVERFWQRARLTQFRLIPSPYSSGGLFALEFKPLQPVLICFNYAAAECKRPCSVYFSTKKRSTEKAERKEDVCSSCCCPRRGSSWDGMTPRAERNLIQFLSESCDVCKQIDWINGCIYLICIKRLIPLPLRRTWILALTRRRLH